MPEVTMEYRNGGSGVSKSSCQPAMRALPEIVASALSCDNLGGSLTSDDIEVKLREMDRDDLTPYGIEITVRANDFPSRKANLDERNQQIREAIEPHLPAGKYKYFVWTTLSPAAFAEGQVDREHGQHASPPMPQAE